jgi:hypothetical protein
VAPPERRAAVEAQRAWLQDEVERHGGAPPAGALAPDPLGLG